MTAPTVAHFRIPFSQCPDFKEIHRICKDYYVIFDVGAEGFYSIVPELVGNGKINRRII